MMLVCSSKLEQVKILKQLAQDLKVVNLTSSMKNRGSTLLLSLNILLESHLFPTLNNYLILFKKINLGGHNISKRMIPKTILSLI
jgi:hypothetical protein